MTKIVNNIPKTERLSDELRKNTLVPVCKDKKTFKIEEITIVLSESGMNCRK